MLWIILQRKQRSVLARTCRFRLKTIISCELQLPERKRHQGVSTNVTEYEVGSESDSDSDSDSYSDDDDQSDSDSDYYYSSDDEEETQVPSIQIAKVQSYKQLPSMDLSKYSIEEENEEDLEEGERKSQSFQEVYL